MRAVVGVDRRSVEAVVGVDRPSVEAVVGQRTGTFDP